MSPINELISDFGFARRQMSNGENSPETGNEPGQGGDPTIKKIGGIHVHLHGSSSLNIVTDNLVGGDQKIEEIDLSSIAKRASHIPVDDFLSLIDVLCEVAAANVDWRSALQKTRPKFDNSDPDSPAEATETALLLRAARRLAAMGASSEGHPLHKFARRLSESEGIAEETRTKLVDWLERVPELTASGPAPSQTAGTAGSKPKQSNPRIVLRVKPDSEGGYSCFAWCLNFPDFPPSRLDGTVSLDELCHFFDRVWFQVAGQVDPKLVSVEVFLPKELFNWAVDQMQVAVDPFRPPISRSFHSVVLRSECRLKGNDYHPRLKTRWEQMPDDGVCSLVDDLCQAPTPQPSGAQQPVKTPPHVVALNGDEQGDHLADIYHELLDRSCIVCGILKPSPRISHDDTDLDVLDALIYTGVPAILWLRETPQASSPAEADELSQLGDLIHQKRLRDLAALVQHERAHGAPHRSKHLAVLIDDPRRPLPNEIARFVSPHKGR